MDKLEKQLLKDFSEKCPGARVLAFFVSGSHFFDLNGPTSDHDYRAIYFPTNEQLKTERLVNRKWQQGTWTRQVDMGIKKKLDGKGKNTKDDVDCIFYSLDEFLKLLANGDFNMLEMLYAPKGKLLITSPEWQELVDRRTMFSPVDLSAFLGFVRKEHSRYGVDESSYWKYEQFVAFLKTLPLTDRLEWHWDKLEAWNQENKVGVVTTALANRDSKRLPAFKVASRLLIGTNRVSTLLDGCQEMLGRFGHRQKSQAEAGCLWKGLYHALRLLYEAQDLIAYGELRLPFDKVRHNNLKNIKDSKLSKEEVFELVTSNLAEVQNYDETQRLNSDMLAHKHDELRHWASQHFYNKKQQQLLNNGAGKTR